MAEPPNEGNAPRQAHEPHEPHEKDTARLESFSDAVYGFAITLLALDLHVPHFEHGGGERGGELAAGAPTAAWLAGALAANWPTYLTFVASFATVIIMWSHHRALCSLVSRTTLRLQFANGLLHIGASVALWIFWAVVPSYVSSKEARAPA